MITYRCPWTLNDVSIWCMGAEVATIDDLDCTLEIDSDGDLVSITLPVDHVTGRTVTVTDEHHPLTWSGDANANAIWCAGLAQVSRHRDRIMDAAGVPTHPYERPEYTGPEYHPTGYGLIRA